MAFALTVILMFVNVLYVLTAFRWFLILKLVDLDVRAAELREQGMRDGKCSAAHVKVLGHTCANTDPSSGCKVNVAKARLSLSEESLHQSVIERCSKRKKRKIDKAHNAVGGIS